jgi:site-specific DNA-methyltransferase (adenine-specific)
MDTRTVVETIGDATLYLGDCREILSGIGRVDAVVTDPPYGMTDAHWDKTLDVWPVIKPGREGAVFILTASQPFTSRVVMGNAADFRCEWIWEKNAGSNFGTVKWQPMKEHESILVFSKATPVYTPIMEERAASGAARVKTAVNYDSQPEAYSGITGKVTSIRPELRYPRSIQKFNRERGLHPNQKPVALMEYFIKTYTLPGQTILDPFMGSGTTGVAALKLGRKFIGIEAERKYFDAALWRLGDGPNEKLWASPSTNHPCMSYEQGLENDLCENCGQMWGDHKF